MTDIQKIELFDTTLRDGTQGEGVNLSITDKLVITERLDDFGIDIIEGGWPGSNPKDEEYFLKVKNLDLKNAKICAFGSTARFPDKVEEDNNLNKLVAAETPYVSIFGKTWRFHSKQSLGLEDAENEELIFKSVKFLKDRGNTVIFDAEHFYDGYKDDSEFAIKMLLAAQEGGADVLVLCDTNGGSITNEIYDITKYVVGKVTKPVGVHCHNDGALGVANTLSGVHAGAEHVQGTFNGFGERCGNADLCGILPNLLLKMGRQTKSEIILENLTSISNYIFETMNLAPHSRAPFVGKSAFAHKGGIHVSSVLKDSRMYEHITPGEVGNIQRVIVSDLSGQSNIRYKAKELGFELPDNKEFSKNFVQNIKGLEYEGFQFDGAEASFELLLKEEMGETSHFFDIPYFKIHVMYNEKGEEYCEAVLKAKVDGVVEHTAADGHGPVNALDNALRKSLTRFYPEISKMHLVDYKVRVLGDSDGTAAKVRVLIDSSDGESTWSTVGVSENIIMASLMAILDSIRYKLYKLRNDK